MYIKRLELHKKILIVDKGILTASVAISFSWATSRCGPDL